MDELFRSPHLVDLILAVVAVELVAVTLIWQRRRRGISPRALLPNLLAGVFLLLALRCALTGAPWFWLAGCLAASGVANAADLRQRWR
ncbi:conserved hypothetical protein [Bradyrhizobium oligotrophicum S58]|uniref:Uncharacterized protein n=1 Tax=Bradyrhizobium oligotrophicum S58 TaxID=1245469 RepID=M4ZDI0_9BRAD|nr:hypothetical protein [Bradyrhizobium oligotrophicum]BAM91883.1 conserved hypothetical protein [Bradyrhizobium oligotrophicum S58]